MIPSYMFCNSFCEWLGKQIFARTLDSNCFGGTPHSSRTPKSSLSGLSPILQPMQAHHYSVTYMQVTVTNGFISMTLHTSTAKAY